MFFMIVAEILLFNHYILVSEQSFKIWLLITVKYLFMHSVSCFANPCHIYIEAQRLYSEKMFLIKGYMINHSIWSFRFVL